MWFDVNLGGLNVSINQSKIFNFVTQFVYFLLVGISGDTKIYLEILNPPLNIIVRFNRFIEDNKM